VIETYPAYCLFGNAACLLLIALLLQILFEDECMYLGIGKKYRNLLLK
jgi:hypothetical protein